jgi:hypothetical protein
MMHTQAQLDAMSMDELKAAISAIQTEKAVAKAGKLTLTRSDKSGGLMLLGLRKFPVTFHDEEWEMILNKANEIRMFIKANPEPARKIG